MQGPLRHSDINGRACGTRSTHEDPERDRDGKGWNCQGWTPEEVDERRNPVGRGTRRVASDLAPDLCAETRRSFRDGLPGKGCQTFVESRRGIAWGFHWNYCYNVDRSLLPARPFRATTEMIAWLRKISRGNPVSASVNLVIGPSWLIATCPSFRPFVANFVSC